MIRVGVIGCGTAGAAAAILLARAGCEVTVLERVEKPGAVGAGIVIQPSGQAVLARLGLLQQIIARGARLERLFLRTERGRTLADLRYAHVDPKWFGIGLHRGVLFEALYGAACREPRVRVHTGADVRALRRDGETIFAGEHGPFDLVVAADGAQSVLRAPGREYPWGALWLVVEDRERAFTGELYQVTRGARRLYGVLPSGRLGDVPLVSIFWSVRAGAAWELDDYKRELCALDPRIEPFVARVHRDDLRLARYRDVAMKQWHDGRVVHIGDAAHATSPQLGQGANLALLDAMVLADCIAAAPVPDALARYTQLRRRHLAYYQRMTRLLTPLFQSDSRVLGWLRDVTFPVANAIGPLRRHMVRTMAGVALGFRAQQLALNSCPD